MDRVRAHVQAEKKKNLKGERCDRNSFYFFYASFFALCPFIFFFIVYTLNWLHFWHWKKAAERERNNENSENRETRQTTWRRDDSRLFRLCKSFLFWLDWNRIDKQSESLRPLDGHVMKFREGFLRVFFSFLGRVTQRRKKIIVQNSIFELVRRSAPKTETEKWNIEISFIKEL